MVAAPVGLTSGNSTVDATSYATASISPTKNRLLLAAVYNRITAGTANVPTLTGNGLTWVQVAFIRNLGNARCLSLFRAMGNPTNGAVTIDMAGQTQLHCMWSICEFDSVDTTGANGANAIVQAVSSNDADAITTSFTVTLAAFASTLNAAYGAFFHANDELSTPGSGFVEIHDTQQSENGVNLMTEYQLANDTSVDASWATASIHLGIAVEIKDSIQNVTRHRAGVPHLGTGQRLGRSW